MQLPYPCTTPPLPTQAPAATISCPRPPSSTLTARALPLPSAPQLANASTQPPLLPSTSPRFHRDAPGLATSCHPSSTICSALAPSATRNAPPSSPGFGSPSAIATATPYSKARVRKRDPDYGASTSGRATILSSHPVMNSAHTAITRRLPALTAHQQWPQALDSRPRPFSSTTFHDLPLFSRP